MTYTYKMPITQDIRLKVKNNGVIKSHLDILWINFVRRTSCDTRIYCWQHWIMNKNI